MACRARFLVGLFAAVVGFASIAGPASAATVAPPPNSGVQLPPTPEHRATSPADLASTLRSDFKGRVLVPANVNWDMTGHSTENDPLFVKSGVQLVGERGQLASRPTLFDNNRAHHGLFTVTEKNVRIEGLHLRGAKSTADHAKDEPLVDAIDIDVDAHTRADRGQVVVADNELNNWAGGGVRVAGAKYYTNPIGNQPDSWDPSEPHPLKEDADLVHVERNYIHHNNQDGAGYAVKVAGGAYATIEGNVFDTNRHSVEGLGNAYSGYIARFNYVLEGGVVQDNFYNQHFDVHGTLDKGYGGNAGTYFRIELNTVRGEQEYYCIPLHCFKTRPVLMLRGTPTEGIFFGGNVMVHDDFGEAVSFKGRKGVNIRSILPTSQRQYNFHDEGGNDYDKDYTREIVAGEFDGESRTDVFLATGTAWFISRGGLRPWELIHESTKTKGDLAFADIDNDHLTDVLYRDGAGKLGYLKSGRGGLLPLTSVPVSIKDIRFGDFDADGKTDMFYSRGGHWYIWFGNTRAWKQVNDSSKTAGELLFGQFDDQPGTDVAAVTGGAWQYSSSAATDWRRMNNMLRKSFDGAVAADFDNDGKSDIAFGDEDKWRYSSDGRSSLRTLRNGGADLKQERIGNFLPVNGDHRQAQVVGFDSSGLKLTVWRGLGNGDAFGPLSSQNMR